MAIFAPQGGDRNGISPEPSALKIYLMKASTGAEGLGLFKFNGHMHPLESFVKMQTVMQWVWGRA